MESRTQGSRPRPRTQKKIRGQGQGPRTQAQVFSKKKKRSTKIFFRQSPNKKVIKNFFQAIYKTLAIKKILLSLSRGQGNFRGLEASKPKTSKCVLEVVLEAKDVFKDSTSANLGVWGRSPQPAEAKGVWGRSL